MMELLCWRNTDALPQMLAQGGRQLLCGIKGGNGTPGRRSDDGHGAALVSGGGGHRRPAEYLTSTACTDVRFWTEHRGKPATCYGPRGGNLHAPDEWVDLDSLRERTKVIAATVMDWCGVHR